MEFKALYSRTRIFMMLAGSKDPFLQYFFWYRNRVEMKEQIRVYFPLFVYSVHSVTKTQCWIL